MISGVDLRDWQDQDQDELRRAVRDMTAMLNNGEWAEHVSADEDAQALESAITKLVDAANAKKRCQK